MTGLIMTLLWAAITIVWTLVMTPVLIALSPIWLIMIYFEKCTFRDVVSEIATQALHHNHQRQSRERASLQSARSRFNCFLRACPARVRQPAFVCPSLLTCTPARLPLRTSSNYGPSVAIT